MGAAGHPFLSSPQLHLIPQGSSFLLELGTPQVVHWGSTLPIPQAVPWLLLGLRTYILVVCSALRRVTRRSGPQGPRSRLRAVSAWTSEVLGAKGMDFWGSGVRARSRAPEAQGMEGITLRSHGLIASEALYRAWGPSNPGVKVILVFRATTLLASCLFPVNHTTGSV